MGFGNVLLLQVGYRGARILMLTLFLSMFICKIVNDYN